MKLTKKIEPNGYTIFLDGTPWIAQYDENSKPMDKSKSIEENCQLQIDEILISDYADKLYRKEITEADVPKEYIERVKAIVDERIKRDSEYSQAQYDAVIESLITEGVL